MTTQQYYYGTGRRKTSVARVRIYKEKGPIIINGKPLEELMGYETWQQIVTEPLKITSNNNNYRVSVKVAGGGVVSQAGAISHGISRALLEAEPELRKTLKQNGLLTRDSREEERKKPGLVRARKAKQYSKR